MLSKVPTSIFTALYPFINIYLSAQIINELTGERDTKKTVDVGMYHDRGKFGMLRDKKCLESMEREQKSSVLTGQSITADIKSMMLRSYQTMMMHSRWLALI